MHVWRISFDPYQAQPSRQFIPDRFSCRCPQTDRFFVLLLEGVLAAEHDILEREIEQRSAIVNWVS